MTLLIFDVESTGYEVCEIAALKTTVGKWEEEDSWSCIIRPTSTRRVAKAMQVHGITEDVLHSMGSLPSAAIIGLESFAQGTNQFLADIYDMEMIRKLYNSAKVTFPYLSRWPYKSNGHFISLKSMLVTWAWEDGLDLQPNQKPLQYWIDRYGLQDMPQHRALDDVRLVLALIQKREL